MMAVRNEREVTARLREASLIRNVLHIVRGAGARAAITAACVRVSEGGSLDVLDVALLDALALLPGPHAGALKKAIDGVLERTGVRRGGGDATAAPAQSARRAPSRSGAALTLFEEAPKPEPRIAPPAGEIVFVDTETTGLKAGAHQVIEIGAQTLDGAEFVALIHLERGAEVNPQAMAINGIDLRGREWRESAVSLRDALEAFIAWLPTGAVLVAHNAAFDRRMLEGDAVRAGVAWPAVEWFCTKLWADDLRKRGVLACADSKLHTLCAHYEIPNDGEHRALADVVRMARVFDAMREVGEEAVAA